MNNKSLFEVADEKMREKFLDVHKCTWNYGDNIGNDEGGSSRFISCILPTLQSRRTKQKSNRKN